MLTQEHRDLLNRVKQHILEEPNRLDMDTWLHHDTPGARYVSGGSTQTVPDCGTVGCIAGWVAVLTAPVQPVSLWDLSVTKAAQQIGWTSPRHDPWLFYVSRWPEELEDAYDHAQTPKERAEATAMAIDRYIELDGNPLPEVTPE